MPPKRRGPKAPKLPQSPTVTSSQLPKSFTQAPPSVTPLLDTLEKEGFYLTNIDRTPPQAKRQLFMGPALLNAAFAVIIVVRLYFAIPTYIAFLEAFFGYESAADVDTQNTPSPELFMILLQRGGLLLFDYTLYSLLGRFVWRFLIEETAWRIAIGFKEEEVVVRISQKWHTKLSPKWSTEDETTVDEIVNPALDKTRLEKNALQLVDKLFVLDTSAMVTAQYLISTEELKLSDLDRKVFTYYPPAGYWIMRSFEDPPMPTRAPDDPNSSLSKLRKNLISKGKEDLFFRYVEIVQFEAAEAADSGFGYRPKAWSEVKKAFDEQGLDLYQITKEMGGERNMPFFEDDA